MHIPKKFEQNDQNKLKQLIRDYPFASLITHSESGLEATHLPFTLSEKEGGLVLQGHIAKANDLWKTVNDKTEVLLLFNGPDCYVSPNYYPTKKEHGKAVPTWNYLVLHVRGLMSYVHDAAWKINMLTDLTAQHESNQVIPWSLEDAPETYIEKLLSAIVGIEIQVSTLKGQWKISQNQPDINKQGVVDGLSQRGDENPQKIAALIKAYVASNRDDQQVV